MDGNVGVTPKSTQNADGPDSQGLCWKTPCMRHSPEISAIQKNV